VSVAVDLEALGQRIVEFGPAAFLVTVGDGGAPHVVSVQVTTDGARLATRVGRHTSANLLARPSLTLLWPARPGGAYSLLVDGSAEGPIEPDGGSLWVCPTRAVLHRVADAAGAGPTCLPIDPD